MFCDVRGEDPHSWEADVPKSTVLLSGATLNQFLSNALGKAKETAQLISYYSSIRWSNEEMQCLGWRVCADFQEARWGN